MINPQPCMHAHLVCLLIITCVVPAGGSRPMLNINMSPGHAWADGVRASGQGIPTIERTPKGRLWVAFRSEYNKPQMERSVMLVTSDDDGKSWSGPKVVIHQNGDSISPFDPVLWHDPNGRLWFFWSQRPGMDVWAMTTVDAEATMPAWTEPRKLMHGVMMNKPTVVSTGEWLFPATPWGDETVVYISETEGQSIRKLGKADIPGVQYNEHMLIEREAGCLWMLVRTWEPEGIMQTVSTDQGKTWTPGERYKKGPNTRFHIRRLHSGRLLLIYHHDTTERTNLTAFLSHDDGNTWSHQLMLDERSDLSYPDAIQADDGRIYVVYDRLRRSAQEVLMATFEEADIKAGAFVTAQARAKVLVNNNRQP